MQATNEDYDPFHENKKHWMEEHFKIIYDEQIQCGLFWLDKWDNKIVYNTLVALRAPIFAFVRVAIIFILCLKCESW